MKFFRVNPNGNAEDCTDYTNYEVYYSERGKYYYLSITPCHKTECGWQHLFNFVPRNITMCNVKRGNEKVLKMCEDWLERNIDYVDKAFVTGGMEAVREYFDKNWLAIGGK